MLDADVVGAAVVDFFGLKSAFDQFLLDMNRTYSDQQEFEVRLKIFADNLKEIHEHNSRGTSPWKASVNKFSDLTREQDQPEDRTLFEDPHILMSCLTLNVMQIFSFNPPEIFARFFSYGRGRVPEYLFEGIREIKGCRSPPKRLQRFFRCQKRYRWASPAGSSQAEMLNKLSGEE